MAQHPHEIVSQRGVSLPFALFSKPWYRASTGEIPLLRGGGISPPLRMLSKRETVRKGEGVIASHWPCNERRTAVHTGGILQYKWEVYCSVSLSSRLRSKEGTAIRMGAYCPRNYGGVLGNGRNTVSKALFRNRQLTEFCNKLGEFCEELGEFASAHT